MRQRPGRLVVAQPQHALRAQRADAILLTRHMAHGPEPHRQRQLAVLENRPSHDRGLAPTGRTAPEVAADRQALTPAAPWTNCPFGPPRARHARHAYLSLNRRSAGVSVFTTGASRNSRWVQPRSKTRSTSGEAVVACFPGSVALANTHNYLRCSCLGAIVIAVHPRLS